MGRSKKNYKNMGVVNINEGWDARAWDKRLHYFVRNRGICRNMIRYHPPYFDAGFIPLDNDDEIGDYCLKCVTLLRDRRNHVPLERFF